MNAIEISNLTKRFGGKTAVDHLTMTVPENAIYGFIGENGSGKSTTEKMICGLLRPAGGSIKLFGKPHTDSAVRAEVSCLIESPACFPHISVWGNLMLQAKNLGIKNPQDEVRKVLKIVRMEGSASSKFKFCSLGMKQRIALAMALMGNPKLLVLDEPINGLDVDGMRIMREVLIEITQQYQCTVVISSHILGELEKIATHYGIIRHGAMIQEMTAAELDAACPTYIALRVKDMDAAKNLLARKYQRVVADHEHQILRVYDHVAPDMVVTYLHQNKITVSEITTQKISLEEYYINLMAKGAQK